MFVTRLTSSDPRYGVDVVVDGQLGCDVAEDDQAAYGIVEDGHDRVAFRCSARCGLTAELGGGFTCTSPERGRDAVPAPGA